eukprot:scaffold31098_cov75-Phaeocystis_antarctica.AAC.2
MASCGGAACSRTSSAVPSERHGGAYFRMRVVMSVWPWTSAHCRAVRPSRSSSSVLAPAFSRACTHAACPAQAAAMSAVPPCMSCRSRLAECCRRRRTMEAWP